MRRLREALEIAREAGLPRRQGGAYINIADVLHVSGRTEEALDGARARGSRPARRARAPTTG